MEYRVLYSYISVLVVLQVKLHQARNADNDLKLMLEPFLRDSPHAPYQPTQVVFCCLTVIDQRQQHA